MTTSSATKPWARWFAKFGVLGFMFFLVKGLLWLAIPAVLVAWRS